MENPLKSISQNIKLFLDWQAVKILKVLQKVLFNLLVVIWLQLLWIFGLNIFQTVWNFIWINIVLDLHEGLEFTSIFHQEPLPPCVFLFDVVLLPDAKGFLMLGVVESSPLLVQKLVRVYQWIFIILLIFIEQLLRWLQVVFSSDWVWSRAYFIYIQHFDHLAPDAREWGLRSLSLWDKLLVNLRRHEILVLEWRFVRVLDRYIRLSRHCLFYNHIVAILVHENFMGVGFDPSSLISQRLNILGWHCTWWDRWLIILFGRNRLHFYWFSASSLNTVLMTLSCVHFHGLFQRYLTFWCHGLQLKLNPSGAKKLRVGLGSVHLVLLK